MSPAGMRPDQAELVDVARRVFVDELLPLLPADRRLTGLMVANALGIAGRMMADPLEADDDSSRLCAEIRAGLHDADDGDRLRAHLIERTLARVAISAPKALAAAERELAGAARP